jgi:hypothetical protein
MKNLLLGIVIGLCIIAFVKAANPLDSARLFGFQVRMGLSMATVTSLASHQTAESYGKNSVDNLSRFRIVAVVV